ncbi:hypothetical protein U9M48_028861 [Paspalum notatum var. saurae]|uniref:Uncharacterized protein n=1 Tax=Paspalum notatum var. saurae TaxID=547442 RepID=A0AAQ3X269_PASNO
MAFSPPRTSSSKLPPLHSFTGAQRLLPWPPLFVGMPPPWCCSGRASSSTRRRPTPTARDSLLRRIKPRHRGVQTAPCRTGRHRLCPSLSFLCRAAWMCLPASTASCSPTPIDELHPWSWTSLCSVVTHGRCSMKCPNKPCTTCILAAHPVFDVLSKR